ncbi:hypothetical protein G6F66_014982 [Rhizopus arrhizus]|nr:hypothetical protein G6F66_014982 [Rhizopus arrhizus]
MQGDARAHRRRLRDEHLRVPGGLARSRAAEAACLVRRGRGRRLHAPAGNLPAAGRGRFAGPGGAADARDLQGGVTVVRRRGLHGGGQAGRLGNDGQGPARPAAFGGCAAAAGTAG